MRLSDPRLPYTDSVPELKRQLAALFRDLHAQVNGVSEGAIHAATNATTAAPTTGTYQRGDFIRNSSPSESGAPGSKYVILGWSCVTAGTPGTWVECRCLTGA
jgi:hypothetical protein